MECRARGVRGGVGLGAFPSPRVPGTAAASRGWRPPSRVRACSAPWCTAPAYTPSSERSWRRFGGWCLCWRDPGAFANPCSLNSAVQGGQLRWPERFSRDAFGGLGTSPGNEDDTEQKNQDRNPQSPKEDGAGGQPPEKPGVSGRAGQRTHGEKA